MLQCWPTLQLGMIRRTIRSHDIGIMYKTLVRPHYQNSWTLWRLGLKRDEIWSTGAVNHTFNGPFVHLLLLVCVSLTTIGQPQNSRVHPRQAAIQLCQGTGLDNVRHRLGLTTRTQISVCKSPCTAVSLFRAKTVQQRPLLPREVETWLPDCGVTH